MILSSCPTFGLVIFCHLPQYSKSGCSTSIMQARSHLQCHVIWLGGAPYRSKNLAAVEQCHHSLPCCQLYRSMRSPKPCVLDPVSDPSRQGQPQGQHQWGGNIKPTGSNPGVRRAGEGSATPSSILPWGRGRRG